MANLTPHGLLSSGERAYLKKAIHGKAAAHATKAPQRIEAKVAHLPASIDRLVGDCRLLTELRLSKGGLKKPGKHEPGLDALLRLVLLHDVGAYQKSFHQLPIVLLLISTLSALSKMTGGNDEAIVKALYAHAEAAGKNPKLAKEAKQFKDGMTMAAGILSVVKKGLRHSPHLDWVLGSLIRMKTLIALFVLEGEKEAWVPLDPIVDSVPAGKKIVMFRVLSEAVGTDLAEEKVTRSPASGGKIHHYRLTGGGRETVTAVLIEHPEFLDS